MHRRTRSGFTIPEQEVSLLDEKNERGVEAHEQAFGLIPSSRKRSSKSPSPTSLLLALSLALFLSISAAFSFLWRQQTTPLAHPSSSLPIQPGHWITTWAAAPQARNLSAVIPEFFDQQDDTELANTTIRQTFRVSIGGDRIRLRLSNAFSDKPLRIEAATVALPVSERHPGDTNATTRSGSGSPRIHLSTLASLTFAGERSVTIPPHGLVVSDVVEGFQVATRGAVSVSMYFAEGQSSDELASHRISRTTSWLAKGDETASHSLR